MAKDTAQEILDAAQEMVRSRGYSAFSYADISERVGIRKASIHYHFSTKEDLVRTLVQRYREGMAKACDRILQSNAHPSEQVQQFANLYRDGLANHQICLCAMLSADFEVLPTSIQTEIQSFFEVTENCLSTLLQQGCEADLWTCEPSVALESKGLISLLQGAQLLARSAPDSAATFEQVVNPTLKAKFAVS